MSLPLTAADYVRSLKEGNPEDPKSEAYQKRFEYKPRPLLDKILNVMNEVHNYSVNLEGRDQLMGEKTKELLETGIDNLLVVCGRDHVEGIEKYLTRTMQLSLLGSVEIMEGEVVMATSIGKNKHRPL